MFFVTHFVFLNLDKQHPVGETTDVGRVTASPLFKCPRVHPCECGGIHEDVTISLTLLKKVSFMGKYILPKIVTVYRKSVGSPFR
jgi:hypothetical protein